jgi:hypothetical protein
MNLGLPQRCSDYQLGKQAFRCVDSSTSPRRQITGNTLSKQDWLFPKVTAPDLGGLEIRKLISTSLRPGHLAILAQARSFKGREANSLL